MDLRADKLKATLSKEMILKQETEHKHLSVGSAPDRTVSNDGIVPLTCVKAMMVTDAKETNISNDMKHDEFDFVSSVSNDSVETRGHSSNELPSKSIDNQIVPNQEILKQPPLSTSATKSVSFAPTKRVSEFDIDDTNETTFPEEELEVDFCRVSKLRKTPRLARRIKVEATASSFVTKLLHPSVSVQPKSEQKPVLQKVPSADITTSNVTNKKSTIQVALIHSHNHTQIIHRTMQYIHRDRDLMLESLFKWCGIFHGAAKGGPLSSFLSVVPPVMGTRTLLEEFHDCDYLNLLQYPSRTDNISCNTDSDANHDRFNDLCKESRTAEDSSLYDANQELQKQYSKYGLEDDCPIPTDPDAHAQLWNYCLAVTGASCHAASLLFSQQNSKSRSSCAADVAIHWGGGRHHAHNNKAGGFCYVNDIVLAIRKLVKDITTNIEGGQTAHGKRKSARVLYIDLDIHHPDGVQSAFYSTDEVLTASFHRHSAGFFPATSGATAEKGQLGSKGLGYNINVPLPAGTSDMTFLHMYRKLLFGLVNVYDPQSIVLCIGADGLKGDPLVEGGSSDFGGAKFMSEVAANDISYYTRRDTFDGSCSNGEGWLLSPECLAECVRIASALCAGLKPSNENEKDTVKADPAAIPVDCSDSKTDATNKPSFKKKSTQKGKRRKLLLLGGGGYSPSQTARSWLLCTAAACEGARPGLFWSRLPKDVPNHCYFPRYGPTFELVSEDKQREISSYYLSSNEKQMIQMRAGLSQSDQDTLHKGLKAIELTCLYIERQRTKANSSPASSVPSKGYYFDELLQKDDNICFETRSITKENSGNQTIRRGRRKKTKLSSAS
jgi:acetoin utilization deacetylase AcuC-like enzyme